VIVVALLVALVALVAVALTSRARPGRGSARPAPSAPPSPGGRVEADLTRWRDAGLLSADEVAAILAFEGTRPVETPPPAPVAVGAARSARRVPVVAEALGYLGGMLAVIGLGLIVGRYWPDLSVAGRLALSAGVAGGLLYGGVAVDPEADPAFARLRGFLWLASTAATVLFVGVLVRDGLEVEESSVVAAACGGAAVVHSGLLWRRQDRPLQQAAALIGALVLAGATAASVFGQEAWGPAVWPAAAGILALGLRRSTPAPLLSEAIGSLGVIAGSSLVLGADWVALGILLGVATALGLLALAAVPGWAPDREDQVLLTVAGALAFVWAVPSAITYFAYEAGAATGAVVWCLGGAVVLLGDRRLVRAPVVAEGMGALAMLGGAAVIGAQWAGVAPIVGLATSLGLLALGMLPGRVVLSFVGSLGLLVNVPWVIGHFFPGENRAPLLILVSGLVLLAVAILLTRMRARFGTELRGSVGDAVGSAPA
jgi:hypothetical protein